MDLVPWPCIPLMTSLTSLRSQPRGPHPPPPIILRVKIEYSYHIKILAPAAVAGTDLHKTQGVQRSIYYTRYGHVFFCW